MQFSWNQLEIVKKLSCNLNTRDVHMLFNELFIQTSYCISASCCITGCTHTTENNALHKRGNGPITKETYTKEINMHTNINELHETHPRYRRLRYQIPQGDRNRFC
jgi:hypothetical protein